MSQVATAILISPVAAAFFEIEILRAGKLKPLDHPPPIVERYEKPVLARRVHRAERDPLLGRLGLFGNLGRLGGLLFAVCWFLLGWLLFGFGLLLGLFLGQGNWLLGL